MARGPGRGGHPRRSWWADPEAIAKEAVAGTATGRFTRPDEVADVVVLLAGGRAGNVTGSDVVIDGGLVTTL